MRLRVFGRPRNHITNHLGNFLGHHRRVHSVFGRIAGFRFFFALIISLSFGVRLLGEKDLVNLAQWNIQNPSKTELTFLDGTHEIWHERGYLGFVFDKISISTSSSFSNWLAKARGNESIHAMFLYPNQLAEIQNELSEDIKARLTFTEIERLRPRREIDLRTLIEGSLACAMKDTDCADNHDKLFRETVLVQLATP